MQFARCARGRVISALNGPATSRAESCLPSIHFRKLYELPSSLRCEDRQIRFVEAGRRFVPSLALQHVAASEFEERLHVLRVEVFFGHKVEFRRDEREI